MRALIQRVKAASVAVDGEVISRINRGWLVLLGVGHGDSEDDANYLATKIADLRAFEDTDGKMNFAVGETGGKILVVSQFTLFGDTSRGRRPSFTNAAPPAEANALYVRFIDLLKARGLAVETGRFQAKMDVQLVNDGPVTFWLDSRA
jgi:D-tyrosyl-tRNA(Tyr) deacylase